MTDPIDPRRRRFLEGALAAAGTGLASTAWAAPEASAASSPVDVFAEPGPVTWTLGIEDVDALFSHVAGLGMRALQFASDQRHYEPSAVVKASERHGVKVVAVDPFDCGPRDPKSASAKGAIAYYKQTVDFAVACGAPAITLQGLTTWVKNAQSKQAAYARLVECVKAVSDYAGSKGIATWFEPCNHYEIPLIHNVDEYFQLTEDADSPQVGLVFDSFHMNIDDPAPLRSLERAGDRLVSYQISDSNRGGIGDGHVDFLGQVQTMKAIGFTGTVAIEVGLFDRIPHNPPKRPEDLARLDAKLKKTAALWKAMVAAA